MIFEFSGEEIITTVVLRTVSSTEFSQLSTYRLCEINRSGHENRYVSFNRSVWSVPRLVGILPAIST